MRGQDAARKRVPLPTDDRLLAHLQNLAREIRVLSIVGIHHAGSGHPGGSLSAADLLAVLYGAELRIDPHATDDPGRDRFILSKGHAAPALYAAWAAIGHLPKDEIKSLRQLGSRLQGHPHVLETPLAETSTGSLGQGFSVGIGMAMGLRLQGIPARVYAMLGDGEMQEGEVWEGAMCAAHHALDNLCILIDYNKLQSDATNAATMTIEPLAGKWAAFGWHVLEIDGHDFADICRGLAEARTCKGRPTALIAHTVKGRGVSFMENVPAWHGSVKMKAEETQRALAELGTDPGEIADLMKETIHVRASA